MSSTISKYKTSACKLPEISRGYFPGENGLWHKVPKMNPAMFLMSYESDIVYVGEYQVAFRLCAISSQ